jgi:MFS family permease
MTIRLYIRLSLMMFLEFFIMGAWYVTVSNYMTPNGMSSSIYWAYTVVPVSALVSPYFLGLVADRYLATEKVLGVLHLIGGIAMFCSP